MNSRTFNNRMPKRFPVNPADQNIAQWTFSVSRSKFVEHPHSQQNTRQLLRSDTFPYTPPALRRAEDALANLKRGGVRHPGNARARKQLPDAALSEARNLRPRRCQAHGCSRRAESAPPKRCRNAHSNRPQSPAPSIPRLSGFVQLLHSPQSCQPTSRHKHNTAPCMDPGRP